jgi:hypothetical protein
MTAAQRVTGPGITGGVTTAANQGMAVAPAPYDIQLVNIPAGNTQAIINLPAVAGRAYLVHSLAFSMLFQNGITTSITKEVRVLDGATYLWTSNLYLPIGTATTSFVDRLVVTGLALVGAVGHGLEISFISAAGANTFEKCSVGAYLL